MDLVLVSWCCRHDRENRTLLSTCDPESSHGEDSLIIEFEVENAVWEKELLFGSSAFVLTGLLIRRRR